MAKKFINVALFGHFNGHYYLLGFLYPGQMLTVTSSSHYMWLPTRIKAPTVPWGLSDQLLNSWLVVVMGFQK